MPKHSHKFIEEYDGFIGFGMDRENDELALTYYMQKFSDDELIAIMRSRMDDKEIEEVYNLISGLIKKHLSHPEYHKYFLKKEGKKD